MTVIRGYLEGKIFIKLSGGGGGAFLGGGFRILLTFLEGGKLFGIFFEAFDFYNHF